MLEGAVHGALGGVAVSELLAFPLANSAIAGALGAATALGGIEVAKEMVANPTGVVGPSGYLYPYLSEAKASGIVESP